MKAYETSRGIDVRLAYCCDVCADSFRARLAPSYGMRDVSTVIERQRRCPCGVPLYTVDFNDVVIALATT